MSSSRTGHTGFAVVRAAVPVAIDHAIQVRDAVHDGAVAHRCDADRDVQAVREGVNDGAPVTVGVLEDRDAVAPRPGAAAIGYSREWRHPEAPAGVERQVHRLVDVRLRSNQLDLEPRRYVQCRALGLGASPRGVWCDVDGALGALAESRAPCERDQSQRGEGAGESHERFGRGTWHRREGRDDRVEVARRVRSVKPTVLPYRLYSYALAPFWIEMPPLTSDPSRDSPLAL